MSAEQLLLAVDGLTTRFAIGSRSVTVVNGIDLTLAEGEVLGLVGESGSGKSMTLRSMVGLVRPPGRVEGRVRWKGRDILGLSEAALAEIRGRDIAMVFQEPMTALNPIVTIARQIDESIASHTDLDASARRRRVVELLDLVGIPSAKQRADDYPHQFSGGMRQRAMIAIAIACNPRLLLADEPTTALDVTIQDQILKLLLRLKDELGMAMILVTHDLGVIAQTCDRVAVMYAGRLVETAPVRDLLRTPRHAYTAALLRALPGIKGPRTPLSPIPGAPPSLADLPAGCSFSPRCGLVVPACRETTPPLLALSAARSSACLRHDAVGLEEVA